MIRSRSRPRGGGGAWYSQSGLALNGVLPSYVSQFDRGRYYTSTAGVRAFPYGKRSGAGTHFDSSGRLVWSKTNIFTYSDDLTNAIWTKTDSSISTDGTLTPSGLTAGLVTEGTAGTALVQQQISSFPTHAFYSYSVELKRGNTDWVRLFAGAGGNDVRGWFNLATGAVGTTQANGVAVKPRDAEMVDLGNGWYRCTIFVGSINAAGPVFLTASASADLSTSRVNNSTRYIGRQQLEFYGVDSPKLPLSLTTSAPLYGPRLDYNPTTLAPRGLLVEEARTNSIPNSWALGGGVGVTPTGWVIAAGSGISCAVSAVGYEDGMPYVDFTFSGTASGAVSPTIQFSASNAIAALPTQVWAGGVYIRRVGGSETNTISQQIIPRDAAVALLSAFGTVTVGGLNATSIAKNRVTSTGTAPASTAYVSLRIVKTYALNDVASDVIRVALPQLEGTDKASLSSVIPTYNAAATRVADAYVESIASWLNQTKGTFYAEYIVDSIGTGLFPVIAQLDDGTTNNRVQMYAGSNATATRAGARIDTGGVLQVNGTVANDALFLSTSKAAISYILDNTRTTQNGGTVVADTSCTIPGSSTSLHIGRSVATTTQRWVKEFRYYPDASASDAQLQTLTT